MVLESSVRNAEALWRAFAVVRGHRIIDEPGWLAVDAGGDAGGTRVILRRAVIYRPGRLLPAGLLRMPHVSVFVADHLGTPAGTCMTLKDSNGVGGIYCVAVLPEHRRAGIGRALMLAAMQELAGLPMVLCATSQGAPLYRELGFATALATTYWQPRQPA